MDFISDKGISVELIEAMGSDLSVANAARVSMGVRHTEFTPEDEKLLRNLGLWRHETPFRHPHLTVRIKAPIFVARQLAKHQVGLTWSEVSRRYVDAMPEFFMPLMRERADSIKAGSKDGVIEEAASATKEFEDAIWHCAQAYKTLLNLNVAPEVARCLLPQCMMTEWLWTGSLLAFVRVIKLRTDSHAQAESQAIGWMLEDILRKYFPVSTKYLLANIE